MIDELYRAMGRRVVKGMVKKTKMHIALGVLTYEKFKVRIQN